MIERLQPHHCINEFISNSIIDRWLKTNARDHQTIGRAQTFVAISLQNVQGFYSVQTFNEHRDINGILLIKLAVDIRYQKQGVGKALLQHAIQNAHVVKDLIGCQGIITYAKDDAINFYKHFGFVLINTNMNELFLKI